MSKVSSPDRPVHSPSRTSISRRVFLGSTAGLVGMVPFLPKPSDDLKRAIETHRKAAERFIAVETDYRDKAPDLDGDYRAMRQLEGRLGNALGAMTSAGNDLIAELDRAGLVGCVDAGTLYVAADLEPEGVRRLVMLPASKVRGI